MLAALLIALSFNGAVWAEPIRVVATTPDLADIARHIGGDILSVESLLKGREDPHSAVLAEAPALENADVLITVGMEFESAWLPVLLDAARNEKLSRHYIDASAKITPLNVPSSVPSTVEQHPAGNPHYLLDPENGLLVAAQITDQLSLFFPEHADAFANGRNQFRRALEEKLSGWRSAGEKLRGMKLVSYHPSWDYFARRFHLELVATIEERPGAEPSVRHLEALVVKMKSDGVRTILHEPYVPPRIPLALAERVGARVITLPAMPEEGGAGYLGLFDDLFMKLTK